MDKLKKKVFWVIFLILTVFTTAVLGFYNTQQYNRERTSIVHNLNQAEGFRNEPDENAPRMDSSDIKPVLPKDDRMKYIRYMDKVVYTVVLDEDNSPGEVINHSQNEKTDDEIIEILNTLDVEEGNCKVGNLYTARYSYSEKDSVVTIIDNEETNSRLVSTLLISLGILVALELLILFVSIKITKWITKPVQESFDKQKQFIADASHELKTPLAVIMASSDALESNPEEKRWLENIKSESERMNKLISDLIDLAKSEAVDDRSEFVQGNLSKTVEKSVLTFEGIMFEKGITLDYSIDENIEIEMNEYRIYQLMSILIDNAIKHCSENGKISVCLKKEKDVVLTVSNTGEGIPKGEEERIFERFYRADESRNRNENRYGLGLAIAKNIASSHGAEISAFSENGITTFKTVFK
ncbi:MAG: HAMP domain-containing histidine kinase [Eubacterium sp.]|nr:HAMP domain-containing histidine kinase [Eubacterium sp.]